MVSLIVNGVETFSYAKVLRDLEVMEDLIVHGTESVYMTETHYADLEIAAGYALKTDTISEKTTNAGVTIDGMLVKDSVPYVDTISEKTSDSGVTIDGLLIKDGKLLGTVTVPSVTDTLATLSQAETLTNKTLSTGCSVLGADDLPNTIANLLTDHDRAAHDALGTGSIVFTEESQELTSKTLNTPIIKDIAATPVADRQIVVDGGVLKVRDTSGVEGKYISSSSLEDLDASKITTGTFDEARIPHTFTSVITLNYSTPAISLKGTETGAKEIMVRENAGVTELYDVAGATVIMTLESHASRHNYGGADAITDLDGSVITTGTVDEARLPVNLGVDSLILDRTNRDVNLYRAGADILATDDILQIFRPSGGNAIDIRVSGDTTQRLLLYPGSSSGVIEFGDGTTRDVNLYRGGADILKTDDSISAVDIYSNQANLPYAMLLSNGKVRTIPLNADGTNTLRDSPSLRLTGKYWDGSASVTRDADIFHRTLSTTPTSEIAFQIAGSDYFRVGDDGIRCHQDLLPDSDNARNCGNDTYRWALVRAVTITSGRHNFEDKFYVEETEDTLEFYDYKTNQLLMKLDKEGNLWIRGQLKQLQ